MGKRLNKHEWFVGPCDLKVAQRLVKDYHYSHTSGTPTYCHGMCKSDGKIVGAALWMPPTREAAMNTYPEGDWRKVLSLSRLVCHPDVPKNGASFLMAGSIRIISKQGNWRCLVTYADTSQGHTGAIYRATNWEYVGATVTRDIWRDSQGLMRSKKHGHESYSRDHMIGQGWEQQEACPKHKFRMLLPFKESKGEQVQLFDMAA